MKLIIAGGRDYRFTPGDFARLDALALEHDITEVVSGAAEGADLWGEYWADVNFIRVKTFPADWTAHGRSAGPKRNRKMAEYADAVALFEGGRGTVSMRAEAERAGIRIFDYRV